MKDNIAKIVVAALFTALVVWGVAVVYQVSKHAPKPEPVVYHAPIPPDPPSGTDVRAPEPAPEPSWVDAVPEYKKYSPVPLPPVKKKRLHRRHRVCAPARVPGPLLPPFVVRP